MEIGLDTNMVIIYGIGLLLLYLLGSFLIKIFKVPFKILISILINSLVGIVALFIINVVGANYNFQLGLNPINILIIGLLGIPGLIMLVLINMIV